MTLVSSCAFVFTLFLSFLGHIQKSFCKDLSPSFIFPEVCDSSGVPRSYTLSFEQGRLFPFFRFCFFLEGELSVCRGISFRFIRELTSGSGSYVSDILRTEVPGGFTLEAKAFIRDIFGFTRTAAGNKICFKCCFPPAVCDFKTGSPDEYRGSGKENIKRGSGEERYYMREYIPGDRERDINWKSSGKSDSLFTRISPMIDDEERIIDVIYFPGFHEKKKREVMISEAKALEESFVSFVHMLRKTYSNVVMNIFFPGGNFRVDSDEGEKRLGEIISSSMNFSIDKELSLNDDIFSSPLIVFTDSGNKDPYRLFSKIKAADFRLFFTAEKGREGDRAFASFSKKGAEAILFSAGSFGKKFLI